MGIRFYCPNGHKLNVKSFQAGQKGICPRCGAGVDIPLESTRRSSRAKATDSPSVGAPPRVPGAMPAGSDSRDPLAAAGRAVWYVRPESGGQFGPATGDVMQAWLAEGRVVAGSLVWREGWRQWQRAGSVFPQLAVEQPIIELESILAEPAPVLGPSLPVRRRGPARSVKAVVIGSLLAAAAILLVIFLVIWARR